jgi:hypothetical protein
VSDSIPVTVPAPGDRRDVGIELPLERLLSKSSSSARKGLGEIVEEVVLVALEILGIESRFSKRSRKTA